MQRYVAFLRGMNLGCEDLRSCGRAENRFYIFVDDVDVDVTPAPTPS